MRICGKLIQFIKLPSCPKEDRDGIGTYSSYYSDVASNNEKGNTVSHRAFGSPKHVYLAIFRSFVAFLQSIKKGEYKRLRALMRRGLSGH